MWEEDRKDRIADAVEHLVQPGEAWVIRRTDQKVVVVEEGRSALAASHPELYGSLLQLNEQLSNAGSSLIVFGLLGILAFCVAVHMQWLGPAAEPLRSFWVYGLFLAGGFLLLGAVGKGFENALYRRNRDPLIRALRQAGINPSRLIAEIEGDKALNTLAAQLKKEPALVDL